MSRQTWVISADYARSFKVIRELFLLRRIKRSTALLACFCCTPFGWAKPNRWQYVANTLSTSWAEIKLR